MAQAAHNTAISLIKSPAEVDGEGGLSLVVKVSCSSGCELWSKIMQILNHQGVIIKEAGLVSFDGESNTTEEFIVKAPFEPGEYTWKAIFPAQERKGVLHEASSVSFSFNVRPHAVRVTVWDVPSMVTTDDEFTIKARAECSSGCNLEGKEIKVCDHHGAEVGAGMLSKTPPDVSTLYSVEIKLKAPNAEGRYGWKVIFSDMDTNTPHKEAYFEFPLIVSRQAELVLTVEVIDRDTKALVENAIIYLRPSAYRGISYKGLSDNTGVAKFNVPKGEYNLYIEKNGKEGSKPRLRLDSDVTIKVELLPRLRQHWGFWEY